MNAIDAIRDAFGAFGIENTIAAMAGVASALMVAVIFRTVAVRDPMLRRARTLVERRRSLHAASLAPGRHRTRHMAGAVGLMARVVQRLKLLRTAHAATVARSLARAGWRSKEALVAFLFAKAALPMCVGIVSSVFLFVVPVLYAPVAAKLLACIAGVVAGFYAPELVVRNRATKRAHAIRKGLPDALDLLVICAEAGLSLDAAIARVARETENACPELADEFHLTSIELGFLPSRRDALENLAERTNVPGVRGVVNTLLQTEKYGTPLAQSLRVLSHEFRDERMMRAEEKAARLPAVMTVPLVLFILPSLFVVLLGAAVIQAIDGLGGL